MADKTKVSFLANACVHTSAHTLSIVHPPCQFHTPIKQKHIHKCFNQIHIVCQTETGPFPVETLKCIESKLPKNKRHRFAPMHVSVSVVTNTHKCFKVTHLSASRAPLKTETPKCVRVMHGCITSKHQVFGFWYRALDALKCFTMKRLCL